MMDFIFHWFLNISVMLDEEESDVEPVDGNTSLCYITLPLNLKLKQSISGPGLK